MTYAAPAERDIALVIPSADSVFGSGYGSSPFLNLP